MRQLVTKQPTTLTTLCKVLIIRVKSVVGMITTNLLRNLLQPTTKLLATLFLSLKTYVSINKLNLECSR